MSFDNRFHFKMGQNGMDGILQMENFVVQSYVMPYDSFEQYVIGDNISTKRIVKSFLKLILNLMVCVKYGILMFYRPKWFVVATGEYMQEYHDLKIMAKLCFVLFTSLFIGQIIVLFIMKWRKIKIIEILYYISNDPANCGLYELSRERFEHKTTIFVKFISLFMNRLIVSNFIVINIVLVYNASMKSDILLIPILLLSLATNIFAYLYIISIAVMGISYLYLSVLYLKQVFNDLMLDLKASKDYIKK